MDLAPCNFFSPWYAIRYRGQAAWRMKKQNETTAVREYLSQIVGGSADPSREVDVPLCVAAGSLGLPVDGGDPE